MWSLLGMGEQKVVQMVQVTWPRWPPYPYMVKTIKNIFPGIERPMTMTLGIQHWVLQYYQVCLNDAPGLTLTYFTARSSLVPYAFVWEKVKTVEFSKTIGVYDIKVGRCSQLNESFMSTKGQGHSLLGFLWPLPPINWIFSWNPQPINCNFFQPPSPINKTFGWSTSRSPGKFWNCPNTELFIEVISYTCT